MKSSNRFKRQPIAAGGNTIVFLYDLYLFEVRCLKEEPIDASSKAGIHSSLLGEI